MQCARSHKDKSGMPLKAQHSAFELLMLVDAEAFGAFYMLGGVLPRNPEYVPDCTGIKLSFKHVNMRKEVEIEMKIV